MTDHVTPAERVFRERCYENGRACGFLPFQTAKRMGFHGDFNPDTCEQLYPKQPQPEVNVNVSLDRFG